jgi:hypothetical protein
MELGLILQAENTKKRLYEGKAERIKAHDRYPWDKQCLKVDSDTMKPRTTAYSSIKNVQMSMPRWTCCMLVCQYHFTSMFLVQPNSKELKYLQMAKESRKYIFLIKSWKWSETELVPLLDQLENKTYTNSVLRNPSHLYHTPITVSGGRVIHMFDLLKRTSSEPNKNGNFR